MSKPISHYSGNAPTIPGTAHDMTTIKPGQVWRKRGRRSVRICVWCANNVPGGRIAANRMDTKRRIDVETTPEDLRRDYVLEGMVAPHPMVPR